MKRLKAPENVKEISLTLAGGKSINYKVNSKGQVNVGDNAVEDLLSKGFTLVETKDKTEDKKETEGQENK